MCNGQTTVSETDCKARDELSASLGASSPSGQMCLEDDASCAGECAEAMNSGVNVLSELPNRRGLMLFCPHRMEESISRISVQELWQRGIRGLILDLDNTLVPWQREELPPEVSGWLEEAKQAGLKLCILSNSVLGRRVARVAAELNAIHIRKARKPGRGGFMRALQALHTRPAQTAIIGDQMFTDILGGNRAGVYTIMVQPIHRREFIYTRFVSRPPERILLRFFRKRGHV